MENPNKTESPDLAERLWEQQGKREDHDMGDWLESEYRAHPPIVAAQDETDLRMRGLGPLAEGDHVDSAPVTRPSETKSSPAGPLIIAAGAFVALGVLYSVLRRFSA